MTRTVTLVALIDLGANRACSDISPGSRQAIVDGAGYVRELEDDCVVAYCNPTNLPGTPMTPEASEAIKSKLLDTLLPESIERVSVNALNTIQEADNILCAVAALGMQVQKIIMPCDIEHERRLRITWPHFCQRHFPGGEIEIDFRPKRYVYGRDYAQFLLWSRITWRLVNIAILILMKARGIEAMAKFRQPSFKLMAKLLARARATPASTGSS